MLLQYTPPKSSIDPERGMLERNFNNPDHLKELKRDTLGKRIKERQSEKDQIERKGHQSKEPQRVECINNIIIHLKKKSKTMYMPRVR